jgi:NAD(P)-dependent dehydrogenase (short-subunit alcohol dehydrogenase family)
MSAWTFESIPDQRGRLAIVTGANSGIGYETARALARKGARVILACRSAEKGNAAVERIRAEQPAGTAELAALDLSDLDAVARLADELAKAHEALDLLVDNAGVMVPPLTRTAQGFELQFGTNHLGHFALTGRLLPLLKGTGGSRVVVVSSGVHHGGRMDFDDPNWERRRYNGWKAYAQSKLANLLFALELERRLRAAGARTIVTAAHPGWTATDLQRTSGVARFFNPLLAMKPVDGALPTLRAATDPDATGGSYFGPSRFFEMSGPPVAARVSRRARSTADAARLWALSEELTGVRFDLPAPAAQPSAA